MIDINYVNEENILHVNRMGEIQIEDLFSIVQDTVANFSNIKCLYILDDARESKPRYSSREHPDLLKNISDGLSNFQEVRHAVLVDSPMTTTFGILFEGIANELPHYTFKSFFYEEEARNWLKEGIQKCG